MTLGTTVGDLIERVRRDAVLMARGAIYTLGAAYNANDTQLVLGQSPSHIAFGSILSIDHELFFVSSMNTSTNTAEVVPGYLGTTPANHANGATVEVDPRVPRGQIADFAQQEILSWHHELWRTVGVDVAVDRANRTYDLAGVTDQIYFLLDVRAMPVGTATSFWNYSWVDDSWAHVNARLLRNQNTSQFASGYALQLNALPQKGSTLRVLYATPFDLSTFDTTTDLVADVGLRAEWCEIVEWGAKYRALTAAVTGRTAFRSGHMSREAEEVSTFDVMRASQYAASLRDQRFTKAAVDLRGETPFREG